MKYREYTDLIVNAVNANTLDEFLNVSSETHRRAMEIIFAVAHGCMDDLVRLSGLNMRQFAEKFNISYTTVQNWRYRGTSTPLFVKQLVGYALISETVAE